MVLAVAKNDDQLRATCPVCFGTYAVKPKAGQHVVVLHGYKRPGDGAVKGSCPGAGWPCWEESKAGAEAYAAGIDAHERAAADALRGAESADRVLVWTYERSGDPMRPTAILLTGEVVVDHEGPTVTNREGRKLGLPSWQMANLATAKLAARAAEKRKAAEVAERQAAVEWWRRERERMAEALTSWAPKAPTS